MQNRFDPCIKRNITQTFSNNVYIYIYIYKIVSKKEFNNCINFPYWAVSSFLFVDYFSGTLSSGEE